MLWLNQELDCLRRPAQTLLAKVRQEIEGAVLAVSRSSLVTVLNMSNSTVICVADPSLQSSYPAFVMYTSLIYKNMTTPVYTTLKGVSTTCTTQNTATVLFNLSLMNFI